MRLYLEISQDEYELPIIVCDSASELARRTGLSENNVYSQISKGRKGKYQHPRFISIEVSVGMEM